MSLGESMKRVILREVASNILILTGTPLLTHTNRLLMKWLIEKNMIPMEEVETALHRGLLRYGYRMYFLYRVPSVRLNDPRSSEAIGYAIRNGLFSEVPEEEAQVFCRHHGKTLEEYQALAEGLLEKVLGYILNCPEELPAQSSDSCCCPYCL